MVMELILIHTLFTFQVFHLGLCDRCQEYLDDHSKAELFFGFVRKVALYIKTSYPRLSVIMWDDMYRELDLKTIAGECMYQ